MPFPSRVFPGITEFLNEIKTWIRNQLMPTGTIVMFHGNLADIPKGWALCNGQNGTPDLRGRYPMGCTNSQTTGTYLAAGLPNIKGGYFQYEQQLGQQTGAFSPSFTDTNSGNAVWNDGGGRCNSNIRFDASKSNAIYGKSSTVRPETITVHFIMKVS